MHPLDRDENQPTQPAGQPPVTPSHETASGGASFQGSATPDGTGYSTPTGGHGYAYAPSSPDQRRSRRTRRGFIIAAAISLAVIVFGVCACGAWMAVTNHKTEGDREYGTCDDLHITEGDNETNQDGSFSVSTDDDQLESSVPADKANITKFPAERVDADGDGVADLAYDANGQVQTSAGDATDSAATVVAKVADSVVEIYTENLVYGGFFEQYVSEGAGSGVIISPDGYIVTNHHVIDNAKSITVRLTDGTEYKAKLVGSDEKADIAVLWIDANGRKLSVAKLGSSFDLVVGEEILVIGNPLGSLGGTVTYGKVSATAREISVQNIDMTLLQIDAPINPGNSGGALFNMAGRLVGVVNAKMSSSGIEGLGFAIPIDTAYEVILELIDKETSGGEETTVDRPTLGITVQQKRVNGRYYVYIVESKYSNELKAGDCLLAMGDTDISHLSDIETALSRYEVGDQVTLTIGRGEQTLRVTLTLRARAAE